jgi:hypothetical protein
MESLKDKESHEVQTYLTGMQKAAEILGMDFDHYVNIVTNDKLFKEEDNSRFILILRMTNLIHGAEDDKLARAIKVDPFLRSLFEKVERQLPKILARQQIIDTYGLDEEKGE